MELPRRDHVDLERLNILQGQPIHMGGSKRVVEHLTAPGRPLEAIRGENTGLHFPWVCSRMHPNVPVMDHTEVDFDDPTWLRAMKLCEEDEQPEPEVYKTTLSFFKSLQTTLEGGCSFEDDEGCQCGGSPEVKPPSTWRGAFVGCSDWKAGDPPNHLGGHMALWVPAEVELDRLVKWLSTGI
eukprot:TRINITY_DN7163_c0_g1_i1.p3 TRINITY_DN7163_c0_g1~~TRINITY_DN7163_c0_g1_i1.p3  ORF type:complete len:182 (-),score=4.79 TRINITY_DN7163_c0_g1_i1:161-706(-)